MCVSHALFGVARYQLYDSGDDGRHWTAAGPVRSEYSGLDAVADNGQGTFLAAAASGASTIYYGTDDGATLTDAVVSAPAGGVQWAGLAFINHSDAVVVLDGTALYTTHDAGRHWAPTRF